MNEEIKQTLATKGWVIIEQLLKDEIIDGKKPINFKTDGKRFEDIAIEAMAREKAAKAVDRVLRKIKTMTTIKEIKQRDWK